MRAQRNRGAHLVQEVGCGDCFLPPGGTARRLLGLESEARRKGALGHAEPPLARCAGSGRYPSHWVRSECPAGTANTKMTQALPAGDLQSGWETKEKQISKAQRGQVMLSLCEWLTRY